jgi:hypothetical protein
VIIYGIVKMVCHGDTEAFISLKTSRLVHDSESLMEWL